jgi:hypothetical protein
MDNGKTKGRIMEWTITDEMKRKLQPRVDAIGRTHPQHLTNHVCRAMAMAKTLLPPMTTPEARLLVDTFHGSGLPAADRLPLSSLPEAVGCMVLATILDQPWADPLAREYDEAEGDDDWQTKFRELPVVSFAMRLKKFNPMQVYLLLVVVDFICCLRGDRPGAPVDLSEFFRIEEKPKP